MRHDRAQQANGRLQALPHDVARAGHVLHGRERICQLSHPRHRAVEAKALQILGHAGDGLVDGPPHPAQGGGQRVVGRRRNVAGRERDGRRQDEAPERRNVTPRTLDAGIGPFQVTLRRAVGEHEEPRRVGAVGLDNRLGIDGVALGLAHRLRPADGDRAPILASHQSVGTGLDLVGVVPAPVGVAVGFVTHHALGEETGEGLIDVDVAAELERLGEEAGIEQVQHRVLDAADVLIDRQPRCNLPCGQRLIGAGRAEACEVPR